MEDGDSGPRGPGFLFHGRPHPGGPGVSYVSSAGITRDFPGYGKTCRKDVLGGVDVPVVPDAAGRASPLPGRQAQLRKQVPACRAGLGRRVPAVNHDQAAAVPLTLARKLPANSPQLQSEITRARCRLRTMPGDDHHGRVEPGHVHVRPGPDIPQRGAGLGQPQPAATHRERRPGVVRGLAGAAGLEPRVPGAPGEERAERFVLVSQRLLQRHGGHLVQERQVGVALHRG